MVDGLLVALAVGLVVVGVRVVGVRVVGFFVVGLVVVGLVVVGLVVVGLLDGDWVGLCIKFERACFFATKLERFQFYGTIDVYVNVNQMAGANELVFILEIRQ